MKKSLLFFLASLFFARPIYAQVVTPNLGLRLPPAQAGTWGADYEFNFVTLDSVWGTGTGGLPTTSQQLSDSLTDETGTLKAVFSNAPTFTEKITTPRIDLGVCFELQGAGSPESVVTAPVCSTYRRTDGGAATSLYVKESGAGNTGWIAYGSPAGSGAPTTAGYWTKTADGGLSDEFAMGSLGTGLVKNTATTGVPTIAVAGTDYLSPASPVTNGQLPATLSSKTLDNSNTIAVKDTLLTIQDDADTTKQARFNASGVTTGTTRTLSVPNADTRLMADSDFAGTATGPMERTGTATYVVIKNNSTASAPTTSSDSSAGYAVGSMWLNTATSNWYRATTVGVGTATWQNLGATTEVDGLTTIMGRDNSAVAESYATGLTICNSGDTVCVSRFVDATFGPRDQCSPECDARTFIPTNKNYTIYDQEGAATMLTIDPDAASKNAMYQFGTNYKPIASIAVPLTERGAASIALASIISNQPKAYYATVTDADTDALDFEFPVTARMVGMTTATVRLIGVSVNAAPSGNVVFSCALKAYRPGTDTFTAHSTTGEQTVTLTPAVQYRPVAATSAAITINGTVADGGTIFGSCEVDATSTTSTQMTDFRALARATVQISVNSWSD
jgi:hypothetical protein